MSYKNGGFKTKFIPLQYSGGSSESFTVYTALESVSDTDSYVLVDDKTNKEVSLVYNAEDDCAHGKASLIDVMHALKHHGAGRYQYSNDTSDDIIIEEMTNEEMKRFFN